MYTVHNTLDFWLYQHITKRNIHIEWKAGLVHQKQRLIIADRHLARNLKTTSIWTITVLCSEQVQRHSLMTIFTTISYPKTVITAWLVSLGTLTTPPPPSEKWNYQTTLEDCSNARNKSCCEKLSGCDVITKTALCCCVCWMLIGCPDQK